MNLENRAGRLATPKDIAPQADNNSVLTENRITPARLGRMADPNIGDSGWVSDVFQETPLLPEEERRVAPHTP